MSDAMIRAVNRLLAPVSRAMRSMVLRGVITLVNDAAALQRVQLQMRAMPQPGGSAAAEMADNLEVLGHYGFTSVPHAGAEAVVLAAGGIKAHGLVIAVDDRRYRLTGLQGGEVALYDDLGNVVKLGREALTITGVTQVTVSAPIVVVDSDNVQLGGAGGMAVARVGDPVAGGKITAGSREGHLCMTDLVLAWNPAFEGFDLVLTETDLAVDDGWATAVILSAFCDRRADPGDALPAGADPRGWWGDRVQPLARPQAGNGTNPDRIGSRLWLFEREVQSAANLVRAKKILVEAFQWMLDDGYVTSMSIAVWYPRRAWLGFSITATWPDGSTRTHQDELAWGTP